MDLSPGVEIEGIEVTSTQIPGFFKNPGISALNWMDKGPLGQPRIWLGPMAIGPGPL
jgi:hypothetical protein